jgi:hypothetical protein
MMVGINNFMKPFKPTTLYIKTHNQTGLKYFGKTTGNPFEYQGSGTYWTAHLRKHDNDVTTEILGYYTDRDECIKAANLFSIENNIVKSVNEDNKKIWANQIIENGTDGGNTYRTNYSPHTLESKKKISEAKKGQIPWNNGLKGSTPGNKHPRTEEQKSKISKTLTGRKRNAESNRKTADKLRGRKRPEVAEKLRGRTHTPEAIAKMKLAQQHKGPLSDETKQKIKEARSKQKNIKSFGEQNQGKVIVINKEGKSSRIFKEQYYSQTGLKNEWEWVSHKSKEAITRKNRG